MKAYIYNHIVRISNPSNEIESALGVMLAYEDKSKQYQIKRMSKNPFSRGTDHYKKLVAEASGSLLQTEGDDLLIPPGFADEVKRLISDVEDHRVDTGDEISSLPWQDDRFLKRPLREYQQEAVEVMATSFRGIMNFATGMGKTLTAVHLLRRLKRKTLIICPTKGVAKQFYEELKGAFGNRVGFIGDSTYKPAEITVGIAASVVNNLSRIKGMGLGVVIFDECHHTPANTFFKIASELSIVGRMYGLTATSFRSDGKDVFIRAGCGDILIQRDVQWGVANGWLAKPFFLVRHIETTGSDHDDKLKAYKTHVLKNREMLGRIEGDARTMMNAGKATLILVDQVEHGEMLAKALGIPFAKGEDDQSEEYVKQLNDKKIKGLIGTEGKLGEGTDTKNVDCLILANFAGSKGMVLQAVGRGLRKQDDKTMCTILDYIPAGSTMLKRHAQNRLKWYREITSDVKVVR